MNNALGQEIASVTHSDVGRTTLSDHPVLIRGGAESWPARSHWSAEYLKRLAGDTDIPVWIFSEDPVPSQRGLTRLGDYLDWILASDDEEIAETPDDHKVKYYAGRVNFTLLPERLRDDIELPAYFRKRPGETNLWIGRKATSSGLHCDQTIGLLAQVRGQKKGRLVSPDQWPLLYGYPSKYGPNSYVDILEPDYGRFPLARGITQVYATLEPGDMLYIPPGWWHNLESIDSLTISVNFWWKIPFWRHLSVPNLRGMWLARQRRSMLCKTRLVTKGGVWFFDGWFRRRSKARRAEQAAANGTDRRR